MKKNEVWAYFYLFLCVILWALIPVCSKKVLAGMDSLALLFFSSLISAVTLAIYMLFAGKARLLSNYRIKDYAYMAFLGFLGSFAFYVFLYKAFSLASAQEVFIINYLWPIFIVVFSFFLLHERFSVWKLLGVMVSFVGVAVIVTKGHMYSIQLSSLEGDLYALLAAISFALFSVLGKKASYDETVSVFIYFAVSTLLSLVFVPFFHVYEFSTSVVFWLFVNGVFVNGISYIFWFFALKKGRVHIVSNGVYLTPFVALLFIALFLGERIETYSFVALLMIVSGIFLQIFTGYKSRNRITL